MLAGSDCPGPCRIFGEDLADKEQLVATSGDRFANESFGSAIGIHLRGVDQRHAEIEAGAERSNFVFSTPRVLCHAPCPITAATYGAMSLYGYTTRSVLSGFGSAHSY
jgi:hypothetical protein